MVLYILTFTFLDRMVARYYTYGDVKDLDVFLYSKLHFHRHVDYMSLHALKFMGVLYVQ
jgi:hypothetical protein